MLLFFLTIFFHFFQLSTIWMLIVSGGFNFFYFYWSIDDLQCCISFRCTAKWISYTYSYIHFMVFLLDTSPIEMIKSIIVLMTFTLEDDMTMGVWQTRVHVWCTQELSKLIQSHTSFIIYYTKDNLRIYHFILSL